MSAKTGCAAIRIWPAFATIRASSRCWTRSPTGASNGLMPVPRIAERDSGTHRNVRYHKIPKISMVGRTLAHYRILEKIGAGGMGVVYRAQDTQLERPVALKVVGE